MLKNFFKEHAVRRATSNSLASFYRADKQRIETLLIIGVHGLEKLVFTRVILPVFARQRVGHDVGISDGAFEAGMAEQFLDVAYARAVFE